MDENEKAGPEGRPSTLHDLDARLREGTPAPDADGELRIRLEVSGGTAGEHYHLEFIAHESGEVEVGLLDELRKIDEQVRRTETVTDQVRQLFRAVDVARLAEAARVRQPIPPCSLVGRLTVGDGLQSVTVIYMADPGQAEEAGFRVHPAVEALVGEISSLVSRQLGLEGLEP